MNKRIEISESVIIDRACDEVWAYVEDYRNDGEWRKGLMEMTPTPSGPPAIGTRVHEVVRKFGSVYVTDSVVTDVGPGLRYRFEGTGDSGDVEGGRFVREDAQGRTVFTYDITLTLRGFEARLGGALRPALARGLRHDLASLERRLARSVRA